MIKRSKKKINDVFYTPEKLAIDCISKIPLMNKDLVLDPFYGKGIFYNNYPDYVEKDYCEIELNKDFFKYDKNVDWIISNPPFSKINEVLNFSAKICNKGFGYILYCLSLTHGRIKRMEDKGFYITSIDLTTLPDWAGIPVFFILWEKVDKDKKLFKFDYKYLLSKEEKERLKLLK